MKSSKKLHNLKREKEALENRLIELGHSIQELERIKRNKIMMRDAVDWINQNIWDGEEPPKTSYTGFAPVELKEFVGDMLEDIIDRGE